MDFVAQRLADGRWMRVLTVVDQFTRECLALFADASLNGEKVAYVLDRIVADRGAPQSITVDNGTEFASKPWICGPIKTQCTWTLSGQDDPSKIVTSKASTADSATSA
jgi:putative transposase